MFQCVLHKCHYLNPCIGRKNAIYTLGSIGMNFDRALYFDRFLEGNKEREKNYSSYLIW